jgi:hypothetical protein
VNSSVDDFNPATTLFVCNKWDVVPIKDRDDIKRAVYYRLEQIYQGLRPEQIFYFSTMEVRSNAIVKYAMCIDIPLKREFGQFNFIIIFVCEIILLPKKIKDFVCTFFCGIDYIS